jgi:transketolase
MHSSQQKISPEELAGFMVKAKRLRWEIINMITKAKGSHIGPSLSIVELLLVLYEKILRIDPRRPLASDRDRFLLSKGHGCATLYAVLADKGFFGKDELGTFIQAGSRLGGHPEMQKAPGIEISAGSLAHGLAIAAGTALAAKLNRKQYQTYCLLGDGECEEGAIWEGALFSAQHKLDNLTVIVDYNKFQCSGAVCEIMNLEPLDEKWRAFGWEIIVIDGHNIEEIFAALTRPRVAGKPRAIIANTIKGKGVSFMEGERRFHSMLPNEEELKIAKKELGVVD